MLLRKGYLLPTNKMVGMLSSVILNVVEFVLVYLLYLVGWKNTYLFSIKHQVLFKTRVVFSEQGRNVIQMCVQLKKKACKIELVLSSIFIPFILFYLWSPLRDYWSNPGIADAFPLWLPMMYNTWYIPWMVCS